MSSPEVIALKRKALACKHEGDIEGAKAYLMQAKALEKVASLASTTQQTPPTSTSESNSDSPSTLPATSETPTEGSVITDQTNEEDELLNADVEGEDASPKYTDPVNKAIDEANLDELTQKDVVFSDEELKDADAMISMRDIMEPETFPTNELYEERILANKRKALAAKKSNDLGTAKKSLLLSKELEKARQVLFEGGGGQSEANADEDDGEDYSLLDELFQTPFASAGGQDDGFLEQLFGASATTLDLDDLDDMDAGLLKDMMEAGMQIPTVDEIMASSQERKAVAIQFKKAGNIEAAKGALTESKRLETKATQLANMLKEIQGNNSLENLDPDAALERMMAADDKPKPEEAKPAPEKSLSSADYRALAVKQKQAGNKEAAIAALRQYKEALAQEQSLKAAAERKEWIKELHKEAEFADAQARLFAYFMHFVDTTKGTAMRDAWKEYSRGCSSQALSLETNDNADGYRLERLDKSASLQTLPDLNFVGSSCPMSEHRMEIGVVELLDLHKNDRLKEKRKDSDAGEGDSISMPPAEAIKVKIEVHLPTTGTNSGDDSSEPEPLEYTTDRFEELGKSYVVGASQFFETSERSANHRYAKLLGRRLARKRCVVVSVYYVDTIVTKGLFGRTTRNEDILLGSAGMDLKDLLEANFLAVDVPLIESRRVLGGKVRLAIRSGRPFGESSSDNSMPETSFLTPENYAMIRVPPVKVQSNE